MTVIRLVRHFALAMTTVLLLAGCGEDGAEEAAGDDAAGEVADDGATEQAADDDDTAEEAAAEPGTSVSVAVASTDLGDVLVDGEGMTLYMFDPDDQGPSVCEDDCAAAWPPLITDGEVEAGDGADAGLLGTADRSDGSTQVTYDGWPLYHWASDTVPGDVTGQGVNDVWWVIAPDGSPLRDTGTAAADDDNGDGGPGIDY